jgi:multidrug resistance efflux pump
MTGVDTAGSRKRPVILGAVAVLVPLSVWGLWQGLQNVVGRPIVVTGTIQAKEIPVASKVGGRIGRVLAQEGQLVAPGQALVEFDVPELEAKREQLKASIAEGEARLLELKNGARPQEIEKARAAANEALANWRILKEGYRQEEIRRAKEVAEKARVELDWAHRETQRFMSLADMGAVSRRDAEEFEAKQLAARNTYEAALRDYERMKHGPRADEIEAARQRYLQARATLELLETGTRFEQIEQARAKVDELKAALAEVEAQLNERRIVSPAEAEVSVMDLHAGEVIPANKSIGTLTRLDNIWTRVYLPERELGRVRIGQEVAVKVDAYPGKEFRGKVVQIPGVAEFTPRNVQTPEERSNQVFGLKVVIDNKDRLLRGGMNAEVVLPPPPHDRWQTMARRVR